MKDADGRPLQVFSAHFLHFLQSSYKSDAYDVLCGVSYKVLKVFLRHIKCDDVSRTAKILTSLTMVQKAKIVS